MPPSTPTIKYRKNVNIVLTLTLIHVIYMHICGNTAMNCHSNAASAAKVSNGFNNVSGIANLANAQGTNLDIVRAFSKMKLVRVVIVFIRVYITVKPVNQHSKL